ncbi:MCE family protein [Nocardioides marmoriginsengisoli]|uniref:MCE family protein n=1 Tax=Nocardioides marmoriginsengisoli TaxID=661483 RepID=A0A3N0CN13_9ACTN|nr:MCE family protein [Nocardioides marmoriginsengisoli]RNL64825.1 MCE family protein [Nocardioides marmoriginsengisoli]
MIAGFRSIVIKFTVFAVASALLGLLLVNTMLNGLNGDTRTFKADFADVAGLRVGDDMRVAGVRIGRVQGIKITEKGVQVTFDLVKQQPILDSTRIVMRYQNLLGQRYLALVQTGAEGQPLAPGATVPLARTSPGFDLTELLNGFRPLFEALRPDDVNALATSLVKVLQGEGGTVESLLSQTGKLTNFLADRDQVVGEVLDNLTPVLTNMAGQGTELRATVVELRQLMTGLAEDRKSIGASIDGMSQLIGSTSALLRDIKVPTIAAVKRFNKVMSLFLANKDSFTAAIKSFGSTLAALGRASSYESAVNIYLCSSVIMVGPLKINLNGSNNGPWSEVCR